MELASHAIHECRHCVVMNRECRTVEDSVDLAWEQTSVNVPTRPISAVYYTFPRMLNCGVDLQVLHMSKHLHDILHFVSGIAHTGLYYWLCQERG
jgi:hypothetical protein